MSRSQLVKLLHVLDLDTAVEGFNKYDCTIDFNTIKGFRNMKVSQVSKSDSLRTYCIKPFILHQYKKYI